MMIFKKLFRYTIAYEFSGVWCSPLIAHGLFSGLCSGVPPTGTQETICGIGVYDMQNKLFTISPVLSISPVPCIIFENVQLYGINIYV